MNIEKYIILIPLFLLGNSVLGQRLIINRNYTNKAYTQHSNYIEIISKKKNCRKIQLYTNNGIIYRYGNCEYGWSPDSIGEGKLFLYKLKGNDTVIILERKFLIEERPKATFMLTKSIDRFISKKDLLSETSPFVVYDLPMCSNYPYYGVRKYRIIVIRNYETIYNIENDGMNFQKQTIKVFESLKENDILIFYDIYNPMMYKLDPAQFEVQE
jgi:hypothetical protein